MLQGDYVEPVDLEIEEEVETKKQETEEKPSCAIAWVSAVVLLFVGAVALYYQGNFDGVDSKTLSKDYVKKSQISFKDLPAGDKNRYIDKTLIANIEQENTRLKEELAVLKANSPTAVPTTSAQTSVVNTNTAELQKNAQALEAKNSALEKEVEMLAAESKSLIQELRLLKSEKNVQIMEEGKQKDLTYVKQITCEDMDTGSALITRACRNQVARFLKPYKNKEMYYEVIPMVDGGEFKILQRIKGLGKDAETILGITPKQIRVLSKIANTGLGKNRSREAAWLLRQKLGKDVKVKLVNYQIETKDKKGVIIRVYR